MSEELLPCPFCGGEAVGHDDYGAWFIECRACGSATRACLFAEEVAATWNRRADRWIPVSERLPEKGGLYLVTVVKEEWRTFVDKCFLGRKLTVEGEFMWLCDEQCKITAWRALPEPYKEGKDAER